MKKPVYRPEFDEIARRLTLLRFTDAQLAEFFGVAQLTLINWCRKYPSFRAARAEGKEEADGLVVNALMQRALGYSHKSEKVFLGPNGQVVRAEITTQYPPDPTSAMFWLANRQGDRWKYRPEDGEVRSDTFVIKGGLPDEDGDDA